VYDGTGKPGVLADVGIVDGRIHALGDLSQAQARLEIDATGKAVAPGFINMLSWAVESLIADPKSQSDLRQGVTLEVFGEGWSMGPFTAAQKQEAKALQTHIQYEIDWTSLGEYLERMERQGVACNIASFVGATTVRSYVIGNAERAATPEELSKMKQLVVEAMQQGALGVGSALSYAPGTFASTEELIELAKAAAPFDGMYISHIRSEGDRLLESVDELIRIAREAGVKAEIYHLKAAGKQNWEKLPQVIERVEAARQAGLRISANMYNYIAGATGLDAAMPTWVQADGFDAWRQRLIDPKLRQRVLAEMRNPAAGYENLLQAAGPEGVMLLGFRKDQHSALIGKTLAQVAAERGTSPEELAIDLVIADESRVECAYFLMSEENVRRQIQLPWMTFNSDAPSQAPEGVFLKSSTHPRAYGNFARLLGKYVRDEKLIRLEDAIHRLTLLPAERLALKQRGALRPGYFADLVVFDPKAIQDHATFENPQQYSTGVEHVFVNGILALQNGEPTGALPGQVVRGPGWTGWKSAAQ
jgi:N-acyl-D-amino-acid deacylase